MVSGFSLVLESVFWVSSWVVLFFSWVCCVFSMVVVWLKVLFIRVCMVVLMCCVVFFDSFCFSFVLVMFLGRFRKCDGGWL